MGNPGLKTAAAKIADQAGIPRSIFFGLISQESGWQPSVSSPAGAIGLTQLMPATAQGLGVDPRDPIQNLQGGARYLKQQFDKFGKWDLALAAYNAGPGAVEKYGGIPPYGETQRYVTNVLSGAARGGGTGGRVRPTPTTLPSISAPVAGVDFASYAMKNLSSIAAGKYDPLEALSDLIATIPAGGAQAPSAPAAAVTAGVPRAPAGTKSALFTGSTSGLQKGFLSKVAAAAQAAGATSVRINSGYRSPTHNAAVGGVPRSNHLTGRAIDGEALINGSWVPLGVALQSVAGQFGLRSGNVPGFYHGRPDPVHIDDGSNQ